MIYIVKINDKEYEVEVEKGRASLIRTTEINSSEELLKAAAIADSEEGPIPDKRGTGLSKEDKIIKSPMPGTILDIKVFPGKGVKKGELLLVLEAMKMENEVFAPFDGVVVKVFVTKGTSVATDDMLLTLK